MNNSKAKRILVACDTLVIGGAETFAMRMARYYKELGHQVSLVAIFGDKINYDLVRENAGDIEIISYKFPPLINWLLYRADGLRARMGRYREWRRALIVRKFRKLLLEEKVDVVHTNMFGTLDYFNHAAQGIPGVTLIHSVHADIINMAYHEVSGQVEKLSGYDRDCVKNRLPVILDRINIVACTAQMQVDIFQKWKRMDPAKLVKIYNPVDVKKTETEVLTRKDLGIPEDAFVYGSMARCIPQKGWGQLIPAFIEAAIPNSYLLLIGGGPFLEELKARYGSQSNILFLDNQPAPVKYLKLFDVGISASWFWESLPTAIIDYLSLSKPVIVTDNAESRYMIQGPDGPAGIVVPLHKDQWEVIQGPDPLKVADMAAALKEMYGDKEQRCRFVRNTAASFKQFDRQTIVRQYEALFENQP